MTETRIKISSIVENQLPQFVKEEFPLISEFLSQYYISLENQGGTNDILQNIDQYIKVDNLTNLIDSTTLDGDVTFFDSTIKVKSTAGFPESYGLLLIDSEIITYTNKTSSTFEGCVRGFAGITSYDKKDELTFLDTNSQEHTSNTEVINLSILFLKEFLVKVKKQITPGFEGRELYSNLDERIFIKQAIDFYSSKGTDNSFKILFGALYGEKVEVIRPRDYLIQPSNAQYRITYDLVVEKITGNPEELVNTTLYQQKTDINEYAQGTITKVEKIQRNLKNYYIISLDFDYNKDIRPVGTIYGNFSICPKTKLVTSILSGSNTLNVDSTVGFPEKNGTLIVDLENGTSLTITYKTKTLNQFLNCSGITQDIPELTEIKNNSYASSKDESIKVRILGVLSDLEIPDNTILYSKDDLIKIKSLGIDLKDYKSNNWFFNLQVKYIVSKIQPVDNSINSYIITVYDDNSLRVGDPITLISSTGIEQNGYVTAFYTQRTFTVTFGGEQSNIDLNLNYIIKKNLSIVNTKNYSLTNQYTSNVQNVYFDEKENSLYVASPSLPYYLNEPLEINDRSLILKFDGNYTLDDQDNPNYGTTLEVGNHGFYTGDSIVYKPSSNNTLGVSTGIYFVKKVSNTKIKLSRSRSNIFNDIYLSFEGNVTNATSKIELTDFNYKNLETQLLEPQKIIRKISSPTNDGKIYGTNPGLTGIFINGVELLNYKSKDNIYYGSIEKIIPSSKGSNYDVINPPVLEITDPIGYGATAYCSVIGGLQRINIVDPGFDYLEEPKIDVIGGNGTGASAKVNLVSFEHSVYFNSVATANLVKLNPTNTISFSDYHKFRDHEEVIYVTNDQSGISGLTTNSSYFVNVKDPYTVQLYASFSDSVSGINPIQLNSYGSGNHIFKSKNKKKKIGSISIENSGFNYQNKLTTTNISGINTASDVITIFEHGYKSGEILTYDCTEIPIGGLFPSNSYYVTVLNENQFKLSSVGITSLGYDKTYFYDTKQYINLTDVGSGIHKFNYPEINVSIKGRIGVSTLAGKDFNAVIDPIFRGEIQSVFVESGGSKYGSEEILNYNRQPLFELNSGSGIQLKPIVSNGQIIDVIINSSGKDYNSIPDLEIVGDGTGAVLTPIFSNGTLSEVKVIYGGIGYNKNNTFINVISSGSGAKFTSQIKSWNINLVERLIQTSKIANDDGFLTAGLNNNYGLEYSHAYAPRKLRSLVQTTIVVKGKKVYIPDLQFENKEITSKSHSPIIGWAYDGNPIYGPYGYERNNGGNIKCLISGYTKKSILSDDRPNGYSKGFFVEDYEYSETGDLDEHNGRFCITPEYPNGVYAYFTTINDGEPDDVGIFKDYKKPVFPYVIGNAYKSKPIDFNFDNYSNQDYIDLNKTKWLRNTTPYGLLNSNTSYEYVTNPNSIKLQNSNIKNINSGVIESVKILNPGENYKVNDDLVFNNKIKINSTAKAKVSLIEGKPLSQINASSSSFNDVILYKNNQEFIGFTTVPHDYSTNDIITFTGKYDYKKSGKIKVTNNNLVLSSGIGSALNTGTITYFDVIGNLDFPYIKENDIYQIQDEQVKILNIDTKSSRIRVLRNQNGTVGLVSYFSGTILNEKTKKFAINIGITSSYNFKINKEFYFDPSESLGLGVSFGVGIVSTLYFSNPGVGITEIKIPTKSIYLPNHNLVNGDSLIYSTNGGTSISVSNDGISDFQLEDKSIVYIVKISNDLIGISTDKVGIDSTGNFVGFGSNTNQTLYFTSFGSGTIHSFKTNYENSLVGNISKNIITVTTKEPHELSLLDSVIINAKPGISTTFVVKYNDYNRRLLINPREISSIDIENDIITINEHNYITGQKVLYTSNSPISGLINQGLYYVVVVDYNNIKLSNTYYGATKKIPEIIDLSSSGSGVISLINPPIKAIKNQPIIFDLSDNSLSYLNLSNVVSSAFDFKIYKDNNFKDEFNRNESSSTFDVIKEGKIGIDTTAKVTINVKDETPDILYYKLLPIDLNTNSKIKKEIIIDNEVVSANKILLEKNDYNGKYSITGITSTTFSFNILEEPKFDLLESSSSNIEYYTNSITSKGGIKDILITDKGSGYKLLPGISSVTSVYGKGAILSPVTSTIGKINSIEIQDIGFDYSADYTIRPLAKYPEILVLTPLSTFDYIDIISFGKNYNTIPSLVVIDSLTNKVIKDVILKYSFGDKRVTILKNTSQLNNVTPKIIPINNSNGIKIKNITFDDLTKDVTVTLDAYFSFFKDFPFKVGDKVLIEGVNVNKDPSGRGYNSSNYEYSLFTITSVDPNISGGSGSIVYNLSSYLEYGEIPGIFNKLNSSGRVIPESYFPIFNPVLKNNIFYEGEFVYSDTALGNVQNWDSDNNYLKITTINDFEINQTVIGKTSGSVGIINEIISFESNYKVDAYSVSKKGWNSETGFLNNNFQRVHDSDYYQYFSYDLKSKKDFNTWDNAVSTLNHTSGFKKFANLIIESSQSNNGISTDQNQGDVSATNDFSAFINLNCVNDFDLARENNIIVDNQVQSDEIIFNSAIIQDYIESIGNRVLIIDDISDQFNSNPRSEKYSVVDSFVLDDFRSKKYIISILDGKNGNISEIELISLIHNNNNGFLNQYGNVFTQNSLGSFDFSITGNQGNLLFYPVNSKKNNYNLEIFSFSLKDISSGIGTINLGDVSTIQTSTVLIPSGSNTSTNIVGIASTYRSGKVLVQIGSTDSSYYQYDELTYIHNNNEVYLLEYGKLQTNSFKTYSSIGIGTYNAYISGSDILIDLIPNDTTTKDYIINTMKVVLSDSSSTSTGSLIISGTDINSSSVGIASTSSPEAIVISSYSNLDYNSSYAIVSVEDKTNSTYQVSELVCISNSIDSYMTEFGIIQTESYIGIITSGISGSNTNLYFTPNANVDVDVKVFKVDMGLNDNPEEVSLINGSLNYDHGNYTGTENDIKKDFNLTYKKYPIFKKYFIPNDSKIVNINSDTITIPNHFLVTGEEVTYSYPGYGSTQAVGIATTSIPGIGVTDKLPSTVYIVKVDDSRIKFSASSEDALMTKPKTLDLTSVGIGKSHSLTSKKQNNKVIILIDNLIQSPISFTNEGSVLVKDVSIFDSDLYVSNIDLFRGGDLIKVNNEIMKINSVGVTSTNSISVLRSLLGSNLGVHSASDSVNKVLGNYNIVDNTIYFSDAPFGKVPIVNLTSRPDEVDYIGISTGSTFNGRVFLRSGILDTEDEPYKTNYIFDDISKDFDGSNKTFTIKSNNQDIAGFSTDNAIVLINSIFQGPDSIGIEGDYHLNETIGTTNISFTGVARSTSYDVNTGSIPRGGIILSVGSTPGFGYQPLVSAGGTAIISIAGTIQSISIGNSGSGYRSGIQQIINVGVRTENVNNSTIEFIGTASVQNGNVVSVAITNPGLGYTSSNPPIVVFDDPLSYSNIPLIYSSNSQFGVGEGAFIDIVVGQGSSVISFELKNLGYGYRSGDILTVSIGGTTGIQTNSSNDFSEFEIIVDKTHTDQFSAWSVGSLQVIDPLDSLFDGERTIFPILIEGNQTTIRAKKGSNIDVQATLLIFINDILQIPGKGYIFKGGSTIKFTEAPKIGDKSKIIFYRGTLDVDTILVDILETIKVGDDVTLKDDDILYNEDSRIVTEIVSSDTLKTNLYRGPGIANEDLLRPLLWCRQTEDLFLNGQFVGKDRVIYEPYIQPSSNIIQNIGITTTQLFVESVKTFFDSEREYLHNGTTEKPQNKILIISQDDLVTATATAVVSSSGTISSIILTDGGVGYSTNPSVIISNPVGVATTCYALAEANIENNSVSSIQILNEGCGYDKLNPPIILIESPTPNYEVIDKISYEGDFGIITGIKTTSIGVANTGIVFDLFIPLDSVLRDLKTVKVGVATTGISGIQTGYYFSINKSNVGYGITSLNQLNEIVGIGTTFIDNIYQVAAVSIAQTSVPGIGLTNITQVTVSVSDYNNLSGIGFSNYYGEYSWGKINIPIRKNPRSFESYAKTGGISTSPIVQRYNRLKYVGYSTT